MWCALHQWTAAHQPAQLQRLLETALDLLQSDPSYPSSPDYVGLWIAYTRLCPDPLPFYTDMHAQGVGSGLTVLYTEWADALEAQGRQEEADAVYMRGLLQLCSAQLTDLIARYDAFKRRVAERARQQRPPAQQSAAADSRKRQMDRAEEPQRDPKQSKTAPSASHASAAAVDRSAPPPQPSQPLPLLHGMHSCNSPTVPCDVAMCRAMTSGCYF